MMKRTVLLLAVVLLAAGNPLATDKVLQRADEKYAAVVGKAQEEFNILKAKEGEERLKVYKTALEAANKSGNIDKATALKERIAAYEADGARPRPKDVVAFGGHTYALIPEKVTWHLAKRRCEEMGGHLVCMETPEEAAFMLKLFQAQNENVWIGATDEAVEGEWRWLNGTPVAPEQKAQWGIENELGLSHFIIYYDPTRAFGDVSSGNRFVFACEWEK